jgi:hypothetical protein
MLDLKRVDSESPSDVAHRLQSESANLGLRFSVR